MILFLFVGTGLPAGPYKQGGNYPLPRWIALPEMGALPSPSALPTPPPRGRHDDVKNNKTPAVAGVFML